MLAVSGKIRIAVSQYNRTFRGRLDKLSFNIVALAAMILTSEATADLVISGPTLTSNESGHYRHGVRFTALENVVLTSFDYHNQGMADTIELQDPDGTTLQKLQVAAGNTTFTGSPNWQLNSGQTYLLVGTTQSNGRFGTFVSESNAHLSVIGGVTSDITDRVDVWLDFRNITTVPEPSSLDLLGVVCASVGLIGMGQWKRVT